MASKMITHNDTKSLLTDLKGYNIREDVAGLTMGWSQVCLSCTLPL